MEKLTQRMPDCLVQQVDDWATTAGGLSRNSAINYLVSAGLEVVRGKDVSPETMRRVAAILRQLEEIQ